MRLGFTGTRYGMSAEQKATFWKLINLYKPDLTAFTHGDCMGADVEAAAIVQELCPGLHIDCRPCNYPGTRGYGPATLTHPVKNPFARNRDIVDTSTHMIGTPFETPDPGHGGTWHTIRYSEKQKVPIIIIARNGQYEIKHIRIKHG